MGRRSPKPARSAEQLARIKTAYEDTAEPVVDIMRRFKLEGSELYRLRDDGKWRGRGQGSVAKKLAGTMARPKSQKQIVEERRAEDEARQRELYGTGELRADVDYLKRIMPINREGPLYRVGNVLRTEAEVRDIAARERRLEQPEPAMLNGIGSHRVGRPAMPASAASSSPAKVLPKPVAPALLCEMCDEPHAGAGPKCQFCIDALAEEANLQSKTAVPEPARAEDLDKFNVLARELRSGATVRAAARTAGVSTSTSHKYSERLTPDEVLCGCGRPNSHNGRCWARRAQQSNNLVARVEDLEAKVAKLEQQLGARLEGRQ